MSCFIIDILCRKMYYINNDIMCRTSRKEKRKVKDALITVINCELVYFKNSATGNYDKEMTKINYAINMSNTDRTIGPSILSCYKQGNLLKDIEPYVMKATRSTIEELPTENGSKYVISKLGQKEFK